MKRLLTTGVAGLLITGTLVVFPGISGAEEPPSPAGSAVPDSADAVDRALHFRQSLGLSTAADVLVQAELAANDSVALFGVPLTDAEVEELVERQDVVEQDAALIRSTVTSLVGESGYSGLWMDNTGGGLLTVAVTSRADEVRAVLDSLVAHPERLAVRTLPRSLADLEILADDIRERAGNERLAIAAVRADERSNGVQVLTPEDPDVVRRWLATWLPADLPLVVEAGSITPAGTRYGNSPPLRGGQKINGGGFTCTSAFVARLATSAYFLLSAGHCGQAGVFWDQVGFPVGTTDRSDTSGTDVLRIPIQSAYRSNEVTLTYNPLVSPYPTYRAITSSQSAASDVVGQISCITGQNFDGLRCGELLSRSYGVDIQEQDEPRVVYTGGREVDADCNPGDSGGPALYSGQARGIISVKVTRTLGNDTCVYVHIEPALTAMGLSGVVTSPGLTTPV